MKKTDSIIVTLSIIIGMLFTTPILLLSEPHNADVMEAEARTAAGVSRSVSTPAPATPEPTVAPVVTPTPTPVPTPAPTPVPTPEPAPEPAPEPDPIIDTAAVLNSDQAQRYLALSAEDRAYMSSVCAAYQVYEPIVLGICYNESRFVPNLTHVNTNGTTDWGVAQCNDVTIGVLSAGMGLQDMGQLLDFRTGFEACCCLLAYYQQTYGLSGYDALLAYQEGPGNYFACKRGEQTPWAAYELVKGHAQLYEQLLAI